jgi:hypothetical protein
MTQIERFLSTSLPLSLRVWFAHLPGMVRFWAAHTTLSNFSIAFTLYFCIAYGCGALMAKKRRSYVLGFLVAFFVPVLGAIAVVFYPSKHARKRTPHGYAPDTQKLVQAQKVSPIEGRLCPFCNIKVAQDARVCRVCQLSIEHHSAEAVA